LILPHSNLPGIVAASASRPVGEARVSSLAASIAAPFRPGALMPGARLYWEIARRGYRRWSTYRGATLAGIFTNTVFGFMRAYILLALFHSRPHAGGYTAADALTYIWLTQATLMTVYIWGWFEIAERIRSGDIVSDFQRPVDVQFYWLSQDLGRALYHLVFRGIPPFLIGMLFFRLFLPVNPAVYLLFLVSLMLAVCISFALRFIVNILAFWLFDYRGVNTIASAFWTFLSGFIVPLAIFPPVWRAIAEALPFAGMLATPVDIFLEKDTGLRLLAVLGLQVLWVLVLLGIGRWLLALATRRLVVQGG
jgi:ABC-2 type transport system permease protein